MTEVRGWVRKATAEAIRECADDIDGVADEMRALADEVERRPAVLVREFHDAFGVERGVTDQIRELRARLIAEEAQEAVDALKAEPLDREAVAKELADLLVVTYGTADVLGIDLDAAFGAVHESNMSKLGPGGSVIRRDDGKVLKGPYYREPDMSEAVMEA